MRTCNEVAPSLGNGGPSSPRAAMFWLRAGPFPRNTILKVLMSWNAEGENLGKIKHLDAMPIPANWRMRLCLISVAWIGDKLFVVRWHPLKCQSSGKEEHLVLDVLKECLKNGARL